MGRHRKSDVPSPSSDEDFAEAVLSGGKQNAITKNTANARERQRMRVLSKAFSKLKTTLPWVPPDTKLSKLDTLKLATCYISHLKKLLEEDDESGSVSMDTRDSPETVPCFNSGMQSSSSSPPSSCSPVQVTGAISKSTPGHIHPLNLTWPFTFNGRYAVSVTSQGGASKPYQSHTENTRLRQTAVTKDHHMAPGIIT